MKNFLKHIQIFDLALGVTSAGATALRFSFAFSATCSCRVRYRNSARDRYMEWTNLPYGAVMNKAATSPRWMVKQIPIAAVALRIRVSRPLSEANPKIAKKA